MKDNKGFTLIEVIISSVIIGLLLISLVTAFAAVRKVNTVSSKQDTAISLSSALLECFNNSVYDYDRVKYGSYLNYLEASNICSSTGYNLDLSTADCIETDDYKQITFHNIEKDLGVYKAIVTVKPTTHENVNDFQFPEVNDLAASSTVVIDTKTMTTTYEKDELENYLKDETNAYKANYDNSYDNLTLYELKDMNAEYITYLYNEECKRIDAINAAYAAEGISVVIPYPKFGDDAIYGVDPYAFIPDDEIKKLVVRTMDLNTGRYNEYAEVNCYLRYTLNRDCFDIFGKSDIKFEYEIYKSKYLTDLSNLYIIYEQTDYDKDIINLVNGEDVVEDTLKYNLFFIVGNKFNSDYVRNNVSNLDSTKIISKIDNLKFNYTQKNPNEDMIELFTNYDYLDPSIYKYKKVPDVYKSKDKYTRLFDLSVVIEDENGSNLYSETVTSVLK